MAADFRERKGVCEVLGRNGGINLAFVEVDSEIRIITQGMKSFLCYETSSD
jgi:hypothetical protein